MNPLKICFTVLCLAFSAFAVEIADSLSGSVQNENDSVVAGATVRFGLLSTTTDSNGNFVLDGVVPIRFQAKGPGKEALVFQGNILKVNLNSPKEIDVALFDLRGRTVKSLHPGVLQTGFHAISLFTNNRGDLSHEAYIAVVRFGPTKATFRWIPGLGSSGAQLFFDKPGSLAKKKDAALPGDTIFVSKAGYVARKVPVDISALFGPLPPITLYSEKSLRTAFVSGTCLPGSPIAVASIWEMNNPDTLFYMLSIDSAGKFSGAVNAFNHNTSFMTVVFDTGSSNLHGIIKTSIDSLLDTVAIQGRKISIHGSFASINRSVDTAVITVTSWKDSASDSFLFPLAWSDATTGKYSGTILAPAHAAAKVFVNVVKTDSGLTRLVGGKLAMVDSTTDSAVINCLSSQPIVSVGHDTLLGWGDTMWLHCTASDSVDSIVKYVWQFTGSSINSSDTLPTAFTIVPMFVDSLFLCTVSVTDANNNTTQASLQALMTCSVRNFRVADNEATGWYQTGNFSVFGPGRISAIISPSTANFSAITEAATQTMNQVDQRTVTSVIADLGSSSAAYSLFLEKKSSIGASALNTSANYPDSVMVIDNSPADGIIVYARFKHFFLQLTFGGFLTYGSAEQNAENFIAVYQQRAIKNSICRDQ
jgi:hypothetical protein